MSHYPEKHHPVFWLVDALNSAGATAEFARDERTLGCWGAIVNGQVVVWLIDNRHPHERVKEDPAAAELLKRGALVLCAQKPDAERVGAKWLPLAVTPGYRPPDKPVEKLYDVGFIGYVRDPQRQAVLAHVARHFKLCVQQGAFGDNAVSVYWQSKVGLNVPTQWGDPTCYDLNMRALEILATGTPLLTNWLSVLEELEIQQGINCLTYSSADELLVHIKALIDDPQWAAKMGAAGAKLAQERHTYAHRATQVLEWLK